MLEGVGNPQYLIAGAAVVPGRVDLLLMVVGIVLGTLSSACCRASAAPTASRSCCRSPSAMSPTSAIIMLSCIYWGALFGGAITSILFNIPGEPWSVATTFDGHPMAQQGSAGEALTAAFTSSFVGALFAVHHDHAGRAAGGELRAAVRAGRDFLGLLPGLLQLRRHGQGAAVQDHRRDDARLCARPRSALDQVTGTAAPDLRLRPSCSAASTS